MTDGMRKKLFIALLCAVFALIFLMNAMTPMVGDDYFYHYSFATGERITSVWQIFPSLAAHGHQMNGRYAPHFFVQLFSMLPNAVFDVVNSCVYLLLLLGLYLLARGERRWDLALLATVAAAVFLLPADFGGNMLWAPGACNYLWCATAVVWLLLPVKAAMAGASAGPRGWLLAALCAVALLVGNTSENLSAAFAVVLLACAAYLWRRDRKAPWGLLLMALCVLAGWLLLVLAPGDSQRLTNIAANKDGLGYFLKNFLTALGVYTKFLLLPTLAWCLLFPFAVHRRQPAGTLALSAVLFAGMLLCNFAMTIANYYPYRTVLGPLVLAMAACAVLIPPFAKEREALWHGAALCLCALAVAAALRALPDNYDRFALERARGAEIAAQIEAGETEITTFGIEGKSKYDAYYGAFELTTDKAYVTNVGYAKYLGVQSIVVDRFE